MEKEYTIQDALNQIELNSYDIKDYLEVIIKACRADGNYQIATAMELALKEQNKIINLIEKLQSTF